MIILMNSSKTMDFQQKSTISKHTIPELIKDAEMLVQELRKLSAPDLAKLMKVSDKLAQLNVARYADWQRDLDRSNAKPALLAFKGDIYSGLDVENYQRGDFEFAQQHVRILSGLYGLLRPLDLIQPYRLEMATNLVTPRGKNMYQFWGTKVQASVRALLKQERSGAVVNLCSAEYFKAIKPGLSDITVVTPVFKEYRDGAYRFVTLYAKKARGMMCNYIIQNRLTGVDELKSFDVAGYRFNKTISSDDQWAFTRKEST